MNQKLKKDKTLLPDDSIMEEYTRLEDRINKSLTDIGEKIMSNQSNKCWNSINMSLKRDALSNLVKRRNLRISRSKC